MHLHDLSIAAVHLLQFSASGPFHLTETYQVQFVILHFLQCLTQSGCLKHCSNIPESYSCPFFHANSCHRKSNPVCSCFPFLESVDLWLTGDLRMAPEFGVGSSNYSLRTCLGKFRMVNGISSITDVRLYSLSWSPESRLHYPGVTAVR